MDHKTHIERNPKMMLGMPVIKGTRITDELIMRKLTGGFSMTDLLESYPHLAKEQIHAATKFNASSN